ncbi:MAG: hypothetical protein LBL99_04220 [Holosporaceae bacterium]|jgi:hypothetical protein|nr:hypothetical protein [Holosporaceae bacterium]
MKANKMSQYSASYISSYSSIKIANANDNKPPLKASIVKIAVWLVIAAMAIGLLVI